MPEPIESMEATSSVEELNPLETPNDVVPEPAPTADTVEPNTPPTVEPELFELPDGRKVDGATLSKEWKENFLPEFTRKSQALAAKDTTVPIKNEPTNPLEDPDWAPQTYAEIVQVAKESALQEIANREKAIIEQQQAIENTVSSQLDEVKALDPAVNENDLFLHATKYRFTDLKTAYLNMKDMREVAKSVQQTTVKNIQKRNDPVSVNPNAGGQGIDPSHFSSSRDYLRSLNNR